MWLLRCQVLLLAACVALVAADKYTDENRPYEFGFTIEGEQHRHEKKDEQGIIMGEFGFITADGVYHVTVYATDENGDFKIISMKNIKIGPPLDMPRSGPLPRYDPGLGSPSKITTLRPAIQQPAVQPGIPRQPVAPQVTPPRQPVAPQATPPRQPTAPQVTPHRQPTAAQVTTPRPKISTVNGCSSCKVVITTPRPPPLPPGATPAITPVYPPGGIRPSVPVTGFTPERGIIPPAGVLPGGITRPGIGNPPTRPAGVSPPGSVFPGVTTQPGGVTRPGSVTPPGTIPSGAFTPSAPGGGNQQLPFGQIPGGISPFTPGLNGKPTPGSYPSTVTDSPKYTPDSKFPGSVAPGIKPGFPPTNSVTNAIHPNLPGTRTPDFEDNSVSNPPTSFNPPVKNLVPPIREPSRTPGQVPIGTVQEGLPRGVSMQDIMNLLYKFNYTAGFHGHHESGYRNGDKVGDYFANGRDGYARQVNYVANEFGFQPNITWVKLSPNSPDIPKEDTEKEYGLKGYEFKWYYRNE